jgi:serine/threonine protein kinase
MASPIAATRPEVGAGGEPFLPCALRPGSVEDRYRSLFLIGRGGMGTVEVALERAADGFERVVALKRLLPEGARDPRNKEMFLREARLAALLAHPNVVHAFAFGELYGELFMAMEYVEGEPLSHVLRTADDGDHGLAPELVAFVLAEACDGLHAAHELRDKGGQPLYVVHRDVSPHNVMISYDGHVKLLDFGVAKFEAGGNETRTGEVKGKMAYMSPEQALGEKLDRRSDLFSVGAVLFECVTGRRMWGPGTDLDVMRKLAFESPPRLDSFAANAPRGLVELHARLVARDPEKRPSTARDVAAELRRVASASAQDAEAVRSLMYLLFARHAQSRRAQLTAALEQVAPSRVEQLRRGLEPLVALDQPTSTEPLIVRSPPLGRRPSPKTRASRTRAVVVLALIGAIVAASAAMRKVQNVNMARSADTIGVSTPTPTPTPTPTSSSTSTSTPTPTSTPTSTPTPTPTLAARATPTRAKPPATTFAWSSSPTTTPLDRPHPSAQGPSPSPTKLPDVDPTPF